jgi:hypothetical protein
MKNAEKEACRGLVRGLLMYEENGRNEFKEWVPDGVADFIDDIVDTYGKHNAEADLADIRGELGTEAWAD